MNKGLQYQILETLADGTVIVVAYVILPDGSRRSEFE